MNNTENINKKQRISSGTSKLGNLYRKYIVNSGIDVYMLAIIVLMGLCGLVMVFSASYAYAFSSTGDSTYYIRKQLIFMMFGFVVMLGLAFFTKSSLYKKLAIPAYLGALLLLALVLVMGVSEGEAKRWLYFGPLGFQPSEVAKYALVVMLAWYYQRFYKKVHQKKFWSSFLYSTIIPGIIVVIPAGLVLLENHLSGFIIVLLIGATVMWIGGANKWFFSVGFLVAAGLLVAFVFWCKVSPETVKELFPREYMFKRVDMWLNPENYDVQSDTWQTVQGKIAVGSGGFFGRGLGKSLQKHLFVSQPQNDFIYSIICEELGFVGGVAVIILYFVFMFRGYHIAKNAHDMFSAITVIGIVGHVGIQALLNIGVVTGILPNTGITLPFFSAGGSSLLILLAEMGIILTISKHSRVDR